MKTSFLKLSAIILTILLTGDSCISQEAKYPAEYVCYKVNSTIVVDGKLDETDWKHAPWTEDFADIEGVHMPAPLYRTRAKMLWDEEYFYVAAEIEEPHLWATYEKRDMVIFHENDFEVFIDPDGDTHMYYELEINAKGTVWDLLMGKPYRDGGPAIDAWDIQGLKSAVHLYGDLNNPENEDEKWTIEIAFPWEVLKECATPRKKPSEGDHWRVNFSRVEWKVDVVDGDYQKRINPDTGKPFPENNWVWSPQGAIAMHQPETWAYVQFTETKSGQGNVSFKKNPDEDIKWALRQVYYYETAYLKEHGAFSSDLGKIGANKIMLNNKPFTPAIEAGEEFFYCSYPGIDKSSTWHIREDGRVWKTNN